jgi:hypothetical protein
MNYTEWVSFKKTVMNDLTICKTLSWWGLHMNANETCDIDAFLIKSCPAVVQALYLLSLKLELSAYKTEIACT